MMNYGPAVAIATGFVILCVAGCNQDEARYEISKHADGRTLRLDRKTGEIAVLDGTRITPLKDAKDLEREASEVRSLATAKRWPDLDVGRFRATGSLQTSWRDGRLFYVLTLRSTEAAEKSAVSDPRLRTLLDRTVFSPICRFSLILEDDPFEVFKLAVDFGRTQDAAGSTLFWEAKGNEPMPQDTYRSVDSWNVAWTGRCEPAVSR